MATILNLITVGEKLILEVDANPGAAAGTPAPVGSLAFLEDAGPLGENYIKVGPLDTDWDLVVTLNSGNLVGHGLYRRLAIYDTDPTGPHLDDVVAQNGFDIDVRVQAQPTRTAAITYQIPNPGDAITNADFVLTEGAQTINGDKTFNDNVVIQGNLDVNGTLTSIDTVNTTIQDKLITLNKGGTAASAGDSGIELEENALITGYIMTSTDRTQWCMKAPAVAFEACLDFDLLTADREFKFPDASGTFLLQPLVPSGVANQVTWWLNGTTVTAEVGVAPNALTWDDTNNFFGIQTATPKSILHVGNFTTSGTVGTNSIIIGRPHATANIGNGSTVMGGSAAVNTVSGIDSVVSGSDNIVSGANALGTGSGNTASGGASVVSGTASVASGLNSHASGASATASGVASSASGTSTTASGANSIAAGQAAQATATNAAAFGNTAIASGVASMAQNTSTTAAGDSSHAEGSGSQTTAPATAAHAEGTNTTASAASAHSEGSSTAASGIASHAEGSLTTASGAASHAEGTSTTASAANAHSEGASTLASGIASHAEGTSTTASGLNSHAEGQGTIASGIASHAEGLTTTASGNYSSADGELSVADGANSQASGRKALTGGFAGARVLTDSQNFTTTADAVDSMKLRYNNGYDFVKGGGANLDDGVNLKIRQASSATTDASTTEIQSIAVPNNSVMLVESKVVGVRTGGTSGTVGDSASYVRTVKVKNIAGTVTVLKKQSDYTAEDQSGWGCNHDVTSTNIVVKVNGASNNNVKWYVTTTFKVVTF
jgi:hypothetical protein